MKNPSPIPKNEDKEALVKTSSNKPKSPNEKMFEEPSEKKPSPVPNNEDEETLLETSFIKPKSPLKMYDDSKNLENNYEIIKEDSPNDDELRKRSISNKSLTEAL